MHLEETRQSIRHLVDERNPADGMVAYYAFYHDADKTTIYTYPDNGRVEGFVTLSRTGIDLFRPFVTMRLPIHNLEMSAALLRRALPVGSEAFISAPVAYEPLITALFDLFNYERLVVYQLLDLRVQPQVNVLIMREDEHEMPRFVIKQPIQGHRTTVASAALNWISPYFAEIAVHTRPEYRQRGYGRGVVQMMSDYLLRRKRTPLYVVNPNNTPSLQLAQSLGYVFTGHEEVMLEAKARVNEYI
jgi:RimJ/RimL family protein N-acetyltransferase